MYHKDGKNITTSNRSFWKAATPEALCHHTYELNTSRVQFFNNILFPIKCSCIIQEIITRNNIDTSTRIDEMKSQICDVRLLFD